MAGGIIIKGRGIGGGKPAICVPVTEKSREGIFGAAREIVGRGTDMLEWRMDFFEGVRDLGQVRQTLEGLSGICEDTILLGTFRSRRQGGEWAITAEDYEKLLLEAAKSGCVDILDVEAAELPDAAGTVARIHRHSVLAAASQHYFSHTPETARMEEELAALKRTGADIAKLAVMPQKNTDVLRLLEATAHMKEQDPSYPLITMAMGGMGIVSRISGQVFGSDVTFATIGKASAPGQLPMEDVARILGQISESMEEKYGE